MMIEPEAEYIAAKIAVGFGEKQVLMPYLVNDLGWCYNKIANSTEINKLLVFFYSS